MISVPPLLRMRPDLLFTDRAFFGLLSDGAGGGPGACRRTVLVRRSGLQRVDRERLHVERQLLHLHLSGQRGVAVAVALTAGQSWFDGAVSADSTVSVSTSSVSFVIVQSP